MRSCGTGPAKKRSVVMTRTVVGDRCRDLKRRCKVSQPKHLQAWLAPGRSRKMLGQTPNVTQDSSDSTLRHAGGALYYATDGERRWWVLPGNGARVVCHGAQVAGRASSAITRRPTGRDRRCLGRACRAGSRTRSGTTARRSPAPRQSAPTSPTRCGRASASPRRRFRPTLDHEKQRSRRRQPAAWR